MNKQNDAFVLATCVLAIGIVFVAIGQPVAVVAAQQQRYQQLQQVEPSSSLSSYLSSARQLLNSGVEAHNQVKTYSAMMPNEDPRTAQMLRETIEKTTGKFNVTRIHKCAARP